MQNGSHGVLNAHEKLQIDQANVIRLAISRLAEQEGVTAATKHQLD